MSGPQLSERDLTVLRSFARRIDPADAGAHNNLGVLYYQKGLIPEAIDRFLHALELDPRMQVAAENLEIAYHATGYYDRRVAELRDRLRRDPQDVEAHWELGRTMAALGQWEEAIVEFQLLLARRPEDTAALLQLGLAQRGLGDLEAATATFDRTRELDPASPVALFYYGETLYNRGLVEQAREPLEEAVAHNPDYADAYYLLAFLYGDLGLHEEARAANARATALNPTLARAQSNLSLKRTSGAYATPTPRTSLGHPRPSVSEGAGLAHYNLGLAFRQKGYYVEALREYRMALDTGEDSRLVRQAMAEVHLIRRDLAAALELYEALLAEDPESPKLWNERGVCLHQSGRGEEAGEAYARAVEADASYALAWNNLGVLRSQGPDIELAIEGFQAALRVSPELVAARLNLALVLLHRHRLQLALEAYRHVLSDEPDHAVAWNGVGLVLVELKRFEDAKNAFSRAVEADPRLASAHYNLSFTLSSLGDFDGALRATKRALELEPYYVAQKFSLSIDLQYEHPDIAVVPEISADVMAEGLGEEFAFDERLLSRIFDELEPAAEPQPPPPDDPLALAADYVAKGFLELAAAQVERALARGAPSARATALMGDIFARRGLHGEALERYRQARAIEPALHDARLGEVRALLELGRSAEAIIAADELVQSAPEEVECLVIAARIRLANHDPHGALDYLKRAQVLEPGRADLLQLEAGIAAQLGDLAGAIEACQGALQLDSSLPQVWLDLGRLEERRQNWVAARASYENALELLPSFMEAALALADLLRRIDAADEAIGVLVDALLTDPWDLDALLLLGRTLLDAGQIERAREAFERLLKFAPDDPAALFQLGITYARRRLYGEAVRMWDRVVQVDPGGPYAQSARTHARSARDLKHIFAGAA